MIHKMIAALVPHMPRGFVWMFSRKYIAGKGIGDAIRVARQLNDNGCLVTVDLLGEFITQLPEAERNKNEYLEIIERFTQCRAKGNYSLKPTMFGLLIDKDTCYSNIREIVAKAAEHDNFVRIDMEDSKCVDLEIELFRKLRKEFPGNVGLVFQACLKRTLDDVRKLLDMHSAEAPLSYRLCKGIYVEREEIAYRKPAEINHHFLEDLDFMLRNGIHVGIATHDMKLVEGAFMLIEKYQVPRDRYEFQMLYGVAPTLRKHLVDEGHTVRVYVPFGEQWFAYCTRRLQENPRIASLIIKALFCRR